MRKKINNLLIVLISLVVVFLFLEVVFRLVFKFRHQPRGRMEFPVSQTYKLSDNRELVYDIIPNSDATFNEIQYKINSSGFRDKEFFIVKKKDKRILVVGDSITYGSGIKLKDTFHKQSETFLNNRGHDVEIMAMGVPGYNTSQEFHLIKETGLKFKPDLLILQICPNDFERKLEIKKIKDSNRIYAIPFHDISIPYVIKKGWLSQFLMENSHFYKFINYKLSLKIKKNLPKEMFFLAERASFKYLTRLKKILDKEKVKFGVIIFPKQKKLRRYRFSYLHKRIHTHLKDLQVPFIDLNKKFNSNPNRDIWVDKLHPNAAGSEIAGRMLTNFVIRLL